jgi:hypothetical protein
MVSADTSDKLKDLKQMLPSLSPSEQRTQKVLLERLTGQFSEALNLFQSVQRTEADKEREQVKAARTRSFGLIGPPGGGREYRLDISVPYWVFSAS